MVFFAGLPLSQSYISLQQIFMMSKPLARLQSGSQGFTSKAYQVALDDLKAGAGEDPGATFGSSQLKMWNR